MSIFFSLVHQMKVYAIVLIARPAAVIAAIIPAGMRKDTKWHWVIEGITDHKAVIWNLVPPHVLWMSVTMTTRRLQKDTSVSRCLWQQQRRSRKGFWKRGVANMEVCPVKSCLKKVVNKHPGMCCLNFSFILHHFVVSVLEDVRGSARIRNSEIYTSTSPVYREFSNLSL